jgi:hypothetical protein
MGEVLMDDALLQDDIAQFRRSLAEASDGERCRVLLILLSLLVEEQMPGPTLAPSI